MRRRFLTLVAALSLLLFVATVALWAGSYWVSDFAGWSSPRGFIGALSMGGLLRFELGTYPTRDQGFKCVRYATPPGGGLWSEARARDRRGGWLQRVGIAYARIDYNGDGKMVRRAIYMPHWLLASAFLALPAFMTWSAFRRRLRTKQGFCPVCGYDLRASPDRCPECGTLQSATNEQRQSGEETRPRLQ